MGQVLGVLAKVPEFQQGDDALGGGVDIHRIGAVMVIFRRAIVQKEVLAVVGKASVDGGVELRRAGLPGNGAQGTQIVAGVEVVDPLLSGVLAIGPGTIRTLATDGEAGRFQSGLAELCIARYFPQPHQKGSSQEAGVVDFGPGQWSVAVTGGRVVFLVVENILDKPGRAGSHLEAFRAGSGLMSVQECVAHEGGADDVGHTQGKEAAAGLPGEVVTPAPVAGFSGPQLLEPGDQFAHLARIGKQAEFV